MTLAYVSKKMGPPIVVGEYLTTTAYYRQFNELLAFNSIPLDTTFTGVDIQYNEWVPITFSLDRDYDRMGVGVKGVLDRYTILSFDLYHLQGEDLVYIGGFTAFSLPFNMVFRDLKAGEYYAAFWVVPMYKGQEELPHANIDFILRPYQLVSESETDVEITEAEDTASDDIQETGNEIETGLSDISDSIQTALQISLQPISSAIYSIADAIAISTQNTISEVSRSYTSITDIIFNSFANILDDVDKLSTTITQIISDSMSSIFDEIYNIYERIQIDIATTIDSIFDEISNIYETLKSEIISAIDSFSDFIEQQLITPLTNVFTQIVETLKTIPQHLFDLFVNFFFEKVE